MKKPLPTIFHLKQHSTLLAVLDNSRLAEEMFWLRCDFLPEAAFEQWRSLFDEASATESDDRFSDVYDQLAAAGVYLIDIVAGTKIDDFVIHLDGAEAVLRYADPGDS